MQEKRQFNQPKGNFSRPEHPAQTWLLQNTDAILRFEEADNLKELLDNIQSFVKDKCGSVTTSQLRNIFAKIKSKKQTSQSLQLIRPKLAYIAARQASNEAREVVDFFGNIVAEVKHDPQAPHFVAFFEAIVAYHKLYHSNKK
jgi:CRISPR type III-A-associated protein Csm2